MLGSNCKTLKICSSIIIIWVYFICMLVSHICEKLMACLLLLEEHRNNIIMDLLHKRMNDTNKTDATVMKCPHHQGAQCYLLLCIYLLNRQARVVGVLMSSTILFFLRAKLSLSCFWSERRKTVMNKTYQCNISAKSIPYCSNVCVCVCVLILIQFPTMPFEVCFFMVLHSASSGHSSGCSVYVNSFSHTSYSSPTTNAYFHNRLRKYVRLVSYNRLFSFQSCRSLTYSCRKTNLDLGNLHMWSFLLFELHMNVWIPCLMHIGLTVKFILDLLTPPPCLWISYSGFWTPLSNLSRLINLCVTSGPFKSSSSLMQFFFFSVIQKLLLLF